MKDFIYILVVMSVACQAITEVEQAFKDFGIVPDVFPVAPTKPITFFAFKYKSDNSLYDLLKVTYPSGVEVKFGNELTPTQVIVSWQSESDALYTIILAEPDAPTREDPSDGEVRHWLVVNIPNNSIKDGLAIVQFVGSAPPEGTGFHRYIFFVFKQPAKIKYDGPIVVNVTRDGRFFTKAMQFASDNNLGDPEFGNFFTAQFDDWVPQLGAILDANSSFKRRRN